MTGHVFHPGHHELHGITVVVRTKSETTYVGRFDREDDGLTHLKDVGVHQGDEPSWTEYLRRAKLYGIKVDERMVSVPTDDVTQVVRISDA